MVLFAPTSNAPSLDVIAENARGVTAVYFFLDDAFLLELRGPDAPRLTQGVNELRHAAFGHRDLFIVPQRPTHNGSSYAVVVNRADR